MKLNRRCWNRSLLVGGLEHELYEFPYIGNVMIPTDELHHFSEGWLNHEPVYYDFKTNGMVKGSLGGETSVLRTFRMSGKELVKERVSKERVRQGKS